MTILYSCPCCSDIYRYTVNSEIVVRILFFAKSVKKHIYHVKNSRLWHDLPTSVKDKEFSLVLEGLIFVNLHENKTLAKISEFTVKGQHSTIMFFVSFIRLGQKLLFQW